MAASNPNEYTLTYVWPHLSASKLTEGYTHEKLALIHHIRSEFLERNFCRALR